MLLLLFGNKRQGQTYPTKFIVKDTNLSLLGRASRVEHYFTSEYNKIIWSKYGYVYTFLLKSLQTRQQTTINLIYGDLWGENKLWSQQLKTDNVGMKWTDTPTNFHFRGDFIGYNFVEDRNWVMSTDTKSTTLVRAVT